MKKSTRLLITAAAMAGLYSGSLVVRTHAADAKAGAPAAKDAKDKSACSGKDGCKAKETCKGKHACKGKNACKGQGGCKSGDNGCNGKNSCKGKGGCAAAHKADKKA